MPPLPPDQLLTRARSYVDQALGRLGELETRLALGQDTVGLWASLRANLESARGDLEQLGRAAP